MLLDNQFPDATPGFRSPNNFFRSESELDCFHCSKRTTWFNLDNLLFFCSEDCYRRYVGGEKYHTRQSAE